MADISSITLPDGNTYSFKDDTSGYITGMTILSYGSSTWADFLAAYKAQKVVYCRASSAANPATGSQTRLAFMAYVNNATNPTSVEFQYYRSVSSHSATQQGDQVYVYTLTSANKWTVTVRESYTKIAAGTNMSSSYSSGTLTLKFNGSIPSTAADVGAIAAPSSASSGDVLAYNGTAWVAQAPSGGLSTDVKTALLNCFKHVSWIDNQGQTYYDALCSALHRGLLSMTVDYTQSGTVYETDTLDSLKPSLSVTANYGDGTTENVSDYTLSGTLTEGNSIITVTYLGTTDTFTVTVTASYVSDGLIAYWDGINNTGNGHDSSATTWTDLVGGYVMAEVGSGSSWKNDALQFVGTAGNIYRCDTIWNRPTISTIEFVLRPSSSATQVVATFDRSDEKISGTNNYDARRVILYNDNTVGFVGHSGYTYTNSVNDITSIRKTVAVYNGFDITKAYVNNTLLNLGSTTHSFGISSTGDVYIGSNNTSSTNYIYNGDVCAIRVYNRALTDAEISKNFAYDNTRFSLGL